MRVLLLAVLAVAMTTLSLPSGAAAAGGSVLPPGSHPIPPGNSGADQYVESVPTANGNRSTSGVSSGESGSSPSPSGNGAVPAATQRILVAQGPDGIRTAEFARATAVRAQRPAARRRHVRPHSKRRAPAAGGSGGGAGRGDGASSAGATPSGIATILKALTGLAGPDGGPLLPVILILSLLGAAAIAARRTRRAR